MTSARRCNLDHQEWHAIHYPRSQLSHRARGGGSEGGRGNEGCALEASNMPPGGDGTAADATPSDPERLRATIVDLRNKIASLEVEVERAEARRAVDAPNPVARHNEEVVAEAEHRADEIGIRALTAAERTRALATEKGREIVVQARRDALELVQRARVDAERIVAAVRLQESALWERVRNLQSVVRRTEQLLRELAQTSYDGEVELHETPVVRVAEPAMDPAVQPGVAAEQARTERRIRSARGHSADLPDSVEDLLTALRDGGGTANR